MPMTPDMTVLTPQLFIMSPWTICSGEGISICLYSFLGLPLTAGFSGGASACCAGVSADGTGLEELDVASSCDVIDERRLFACAGLTSASWSVTGRFAPPSGATCSMALTNPWSSPSMAAAWCALKFDLWTKSQFGLARRACAE